VGANKVETKPCEGNQKIKNKSGDKTTEFLIKQIYLPIAAIKRFEIEIQIPKGKNAQKNEISLMQIGGSMDNCLLIGISSSLNCCQIACSKISTTDQQYRNYGYPNFGVHKKYIFIFNLLCHDI